LESSNPDWQAVLNLHAKAQLDLVLAIIALDEAISALQEMQKRLAEVGYWKEVCQNEMLFLIPRLGKKVVQGSATSVPVSLRHDRRTPVRRTGG